jgi:nucleoporin SEH1
MAGSEGHTGAVWRVTWADPEFGGENAILASCGYDKQVILWSETETSRQSEQKKQFHKKTSFILKDSAQDIKFAPKHHGLMLAVAVANGQIKIYRWQ